MSTAWRRSAAGWTAPDGASPTIARSPDRKASSSPKRGEQPSPASPGWSANAIAPTERAPTPSGWTAAPWTCPGPTETSGDRHAGRRLSLKGAQHEESLEGRYYRRLG